jgi:hypothetical protein
MPSLAASLFKEQPNIKVIDIDYKKAKGVCWARSEIQKYYNNEEYYLQLDSHHRFIQDWDEELIEMHKRAVSQSKHNKAVISAYVPSYSTEDNKKTDEFWTLQFARFLEDGPVFTSPTIHPKNPPEKLIRGRFISAHFLFTTGDFVTQVPYNPNIYFHGEEILLAVRAFTSGYDIFHPDKNVCWHFYGRHDHKKHWDENNGWFTQNKLSFAITRYQLNIDGDSEKPENAHLKQYIQDYPLGSMRSLIDYSKFSGIFFNKRVASKNCMKNIEPSEEVEEKLYEIDVRVDLDIVNLKEVIFLAVIIQDKDENEIYRKDFSNFSTENLGAYLDLKISFASDKIPVTKIIWPYCLTTRWDTIQIRNPIE